MVSRKHSTFILFTSRKTEIARCAREARLQGLVARNALVMQFFEQKTFVTSSQQITKFSVEGVNLENNRRYAVVVRDLATRWTQSYPCKTKTSQETERSLRKFLDRQKSRMSFIQHFFGIWHILWRIIMESLYINASSV